MTIKTVIESVSTSLPSLIGSPENNEFQQYKQVENLELINFLHKYALTRPLNKRNERSKFCG